MSTILVIAAHPDDEVLGCGATIARHARQGDKVHIAILAEGATSRDDSRQPGQRRQELAALAAAAGEACAILGAAPPVFGGLPDNRLDSLDLLDIVKIVEKLLRDYRPATVYTHFGGDLNIDHRLVHQAAVTACRPQPGQPVENLLFFEIPSSSEWQTPAAFQPDWFVDVAATLELKRLALERYRSEMRPWPHPRSWPAVEALARWRGATVGVEAAEAFVLGRKLIK